MAALLCADCGKALNTRNEQYAGLCHVCDAPDVCPVTEANKALLPECAELRAECERIRRIGTAEVERQRVIINQNMEDWKALRSECERLREALQELLVASPCEFRGRYCTAHNEGRPCTQETVRAALAAETAKETP